MAVGVGTASAWTARFPRRPLHAKTRRKCGCLKERATGGTGSAAACNRFSWPRRGRRTSSNHASLLVIPPGCLYPHPHDVVAPIL